MPTLQNLTEVRTGSDHREVQAAAGRLLGLEESPQPPTTRRTTRGPKPRPGWDEPGRTTAELRARFGAFGPKHRRTKPEAQGPNGKGMASSGASSFGLPGSGVIRIHGWYRGAASVDLRKEASSNHKSFSCPRSCRTTTPNFFGSLEGRGPRAKPQANRDAA